MLVFLLKYIRTLCTEAYYACDNDSGQAKIIGLNFYMHVIKYVFIITHRYQLSRCIIVIYLPI